MDGFFLDSWMDLVRTLVVGLLAYLGLIFLLRVSGKRTLTKMPLFACALLVPALDGGRVVSRLGELAALGAIAGALFLPAGHWDSFLPRAFPGLRPTGLAVGGTALGAAAAVALGAVLLFRWERSAAWATRGAALACALAYLVALRPVSDPGGPHVVDAVREQWAPYLALEERFPAARVAHTGSIAVLGAQGSRGRNRVEYVHVDDGPPSFHERARALAGRRAELRGDRTGFGYYRANADEEAWRRNLERSGAEVLVCQRMPTWIASRPEYRRTPQGFPLESAWADAAPDVFELFHASPELRVYAIRRERLVAR